MCSSVVLEGSHDALQQRVATEIYESCRSQRLQLHNFPNYSPVVQALKEPHGCDVAEAAYKVCVVKANKLVILKSFAQRWLDFETTTEAAAGMIKDHNASFNKDGDYLDDDTRPMTLGRPQCWHRRLMTDSFYFVLVMRPHPASSCKGGPWGSR